MERTVINDCNTHFRILLLEFCLDVFPKGRPKVLHGKQETTPFSDVVR